MDPRASVEEVRAMFDDGRADEAAAALADLWRGMADPAEPWRPMRSSLLAGLLARAAAAGPTSRRSIESLRQESSPPQGPDPGDHIAVREWCTLNIALGQADRTLSWLDRVESDPAAMQLLRPLSGFIPYILRQAGRWADMARWFPNPAGAIRQAYSVAASWLQRLDADSAHLEPTIRAFARDRAALVYASLLAAGRDGDAVAAAELAASLDGEPARLRSVLVTTAVRSATQARPHQLDWLAAAGDRGEQAMELRERITELLQPRDPEG